MGDVDVCMSVDDLSHQFVPCDVSSPSSVSCVRATRTARRARAARALAKRAALRLWRCGPCSMAGVSPAVMNAGAGGPLQYIADGCGNTVRGRTRDRKRPKPPVQKVEFVELADTNVGQLQPIAARVLVKLLYAARMARTCVHPCATYRSVGRHL